MKPLSKPQLSKIHVLLSQLGLMDDKKEIVNNFSHGRTQSSRELSFEEAKQLIIALSEHSPNERIKSLIFSLAYQSGIIYGSTGEDKKINAAKLNLFLKERGTVKKELNTMSYPELVKTHRQFEAIAKNTQASRDNKQAEKVVIGLLEELNISTSNAKVRK